MFDLSKILRKGIFHVSIFVGIDGSLLRWGRSDDCGYKRQPILIVADKDRRRGGRLLDFHVSGLISCDRIYLEVVLSLEKIR